MTNTRAARTVRVTTGTAFLSRTPATAGSSGSGGVPGTSGRTVGRSLPSALSGIRRRTRLSDSDIRSMRRVGAARLPPPPNCRGSCATQNRHHAGPAGINRRFKRLPSDNLSAESTRRSHRVAAAAGRTCVCRSGQYWTDLFNAENHDTLQKLRSVRQPIRPLPRMWTVWRRRLPTSADRPVRLAARRRYGHAGDRPDRLGVRAVGSRAEPACGHSEPASNARHMTTY